MESLTSVTISLDKLNQNLLDPAVTSLISSGWSVISSVPVTDNGEPKLILIMYKNSKTNDIVIQKIIGFLIITELLVLILIKLGII